MVIRYLLLVCWVAALLLVCSNVQHLNVWQSGIAVVLLAVSLAVIGGF